MRIVRYLLATICFLTYGGSAVFAREPLEDSIKAAYLYQFIRYIEWPSAAKTISETEVVISILFARGIYDILKEKEGAVVNGKKVVVNYYDLPEAVEASHILFVGESHNPIGKILGIFSSKTGLLTIGEQPGFASKGGLIGFVLSEDTVRFQINWKAAQAMGFKISAKLLQLSMVVSTNP